MRRPLPWLAAVLAASCLLPAVAGGGKTLREARRATAAASFVVLEQAGSRLAIAGDRQATIARSGRVRNWTTRDVSYVWHSGPRCYERSTSFNRGDLRRPADLVPRRLDGLLETSRGAARALWGVEHHTDFAPTEYALLLDARGRITQIANRSGRWGAVPPGRWHTARIRYPTAAQFDRLVGPRPSPACRRDQIPPDRSPGPR